jgi:drug/metabolite transporter (DMT)-like permease
MKEISNRVKGTGFILTSAVFYASYGVWSRLMADYFGEFSQAWTRGLVLLIGTLILNSIFKFFKPINKKDWVWFGVIALMGLNQAPYFYGFKHLNVGTATLLFYAALVIGGYVIGRFSFNEKITKVKWVSLVLAILGMLVIYQLVLRHDQLLAVGLTVLAGLMGAGGVCYTKKLSGNYPEIQIMMSYFISIAVVNFIISSIVKDPLPVLAFSTPWLAQFGYLTAFLVANLAVIQGYKHLEPSIGSLIGLAEIIFGVAFGAIFFGEIVGWGVVIGSILILVAAVLPNIKINRKLS